MDNTELARKPESSDIASLAKIGGIVEHVIIAKSFWLLYVEMGHMELTWDSPATQGCMHLSLKC